MKFLLAFLVLAGLCVFSAQGVTTRFLRHLEPVIGAKIEFANEDEASRLRRSESNQPFPDSLKLSFSGYGKEFNFDLSINSLLVEGAKIRVWGENNELLETYTPPSKNYRQETEDGWANVNLLENGLFNALINHEGELYTVEPLSYHERDLSETNKRSLEEKSELVMYRSSDMVGQDQLLCGAVNSYRKRSLPNGDEQTEIVNATFTPRSSFKGRELLTVAMFSCATVYTTKRFTIGFAADYGFYQVYKTAVTSSDTYGTQGIHDAVLAILSNANMVYKVQINVFLSLGTLDIRTTTGGEDWNQSPPCPSTIDDLLTKFTTWRKTQTDPNNGVYHLLTNCFPPPGTVGLAYVGVLCDNQNGAGVSSDSSTTWLTVAHEVGHNFGANHAFEQGQGTTGGIMDYGDGKYQGEYQFHPVYNQPEVCGELKTAMALTAGSNVVPNCWVDFKPTCGNGMIEDGEDCDDSSSCCSNCKFAPGAVCSTGVCCQNCQYAPTTTNCGNQGYCSNGVCTISPCAGYSNLKFCNVDPTNTCQQTCNYNGQCMSLNNFGLDGSAPDGSVCSTSPYSTCQSGKCVALANAPTSAPTAKPTSAPTTQPTSAPTSKPTSAPSSGPTSGPTPTPTPTPTNPPPPPPTPTPTTVPATTWAVQPWGTCSVTCGGGTQSRNVYCVYAGTSQILSDSQCSGTKPATTQACNTQSCTTVNYYWVTSTGSCNAACDSTGTQTVNVYCAAETDFYTAVSDTLCSGSGAKPASGTQSCTGSPCQSSGGWNVGTWSLCSPKCGAGTQTRSVTCSYGSDSICKFFGPKPASSRSCNGPACAIQWQLAINAWGECSASCGVGIQSRLLQCFDGNQVVDSSYCSGLQKPIVETRPCFVQPCGNLTGPTWVATDNWEACNADCGVQGTQTRIWICVDVDNTRLPDSSCQGGMPQNVVQPCYIPCGDTSPTSSPTNAPGLSTGAIVGIAVGLIGAAIILAGVAIGFFIYTKKSSPYAGKQAPSQSVQSLTPHQGEAANPLYNKN